MNNPFKPTFGKEPRVLAGRETTISDILEGLQGDPGDPNRSAILIGPRGSGKTVLLSHIAGLAEELGWISADVTALPGMLNRIIEQTLANGKELLPARPKAKWSELSMSFGPLKASRKRDDETTPSWWIQITQILDALAKTETGLLITVDEVNAKEPELAHLVTDFQHLIRDNRNVALLLAGLPGKVFQMLSHDQFSFLRRAFQHRLDPLSQSDARLVLRKTIEASGRSIEDWSLEQAAKFTTGFPFLVQMTGYQIWRQSPDNPIISRQDVKEGLLAAEEKMEHQILETTVHELSDGDMNFLLAMIKDDDFSRLADIITRLGVTSSSASQYRRRLINQGVIEEFGRGKVQFAMPLLKKYLRKHYTQ